MERKIDLSRHAIAFVITVLVFALGLLLGWQMGYAATSQIQSEFEKLRLDDYTMEIMGLMNQNSTFACGVYNEQIEKFNIETIEFGNKLDFLEKRKGKTDAEVMQLKKSYTLMQMRNYFLLKKIDELCGSSHRVLLYFYSNENYNERADQGLVISAVLAERSGAFVVFHFDVNVDLPVLKVFKDTFGVTTAPTIIIDNRKYEGFMDKGKLLEAINTG
ncbi:MAG: hypothetical protein AB1468_02315 [Candidatus Micrarchaeota archaeon]